MAMQAQAPSSSRLQRFLISKINHQQRVLVSLHNPFVLSDSLISVIYCRLDYGILIMWPRIAKK